MKKDVHVTYISDDNYAVITAVAIASLRDSRNKERIYHIHYISVNVSEKKIEKIRSMEEEKFFIHIIPFEVEEEEFRKDEISATPAAIAKFFLPELLPHLDKVIYLDGDMAIQKDLGELYDTELGNAYAAVVRDIWVEEGASRFLEKLNCGLKRYFNSGMMVMNLKQLRKENISPKLVDYRKNGLNFYMDQDALNVVFRDNVKYVSYRYNYMPAAHEIFSESQFLKIYGMDNTQTSFERMADASIIHYIGADNLNKPWKVYIPYLTDSFMKYYGQSPFAKDGYYDIEKIKQNAKAGYLFPFEFVPQSSKIAIWGAGQVGKAFCRQIEVTKYCNLLAWTDSCWEKYDGKVVSPKQMLDSKAEYVIIAIKRESVALEIREQIKKLGFADEKIIWRYPVVC